MIETQETKARNLLELNIIEEATDTDIERIVPVIKKHVKEVPEPRLLLVFKGMDSWSDVVSLWGKLSGGDDYVDQFERIALVGDPSWKGWLTDTIENLVKIELKFFGLPELDHARNWLKDETS